MPALEMRLIEKSFPGVHALKGVSLSVDVGEVRGLAGENGAGKSTLMKILAGAYVADGGDIYINGESVVFPSPEKMIELGIAVIYQELAQAQHLTVAENIFLGCLPTSRFGRVRWAEACRAATAVMTSLGFEIDPNAKISTLSVARRQMVEIAKAISRNAKVVVLDEPSAVLGDSELQNLFALIKRISREKGVSFIYISHRLKEFFEICDSVSVMRDGTLVATKPIQQVDSNEIIRLMVGRPMADMFPPRQRKFGDVVLELHGLTRHGVIEEITLDVRAGEIVGICGLAGSGRSEVLHAIMGADRLDAGQMVLHKAPFRPSSPRQALRHGVGLLPEDRKQQGAFLQQSVLFNLMVSRERQFAEKLFLRPRNERSVATRLISRLRIKTPSESVAIRNLSGGNQQKCLIARQVNAGCKIFLIDEPTRGVDVGAKREIYEVLSNLTDNEGAALLMVSSELPEVLGFCDRIAVMREGRLTGILDARTASEEQIMTLATVH
jgi:ribose transport system ATP-binding protein